MILNFTVDGRMPVNAADFPVLSVLVVREGLKEHQILGNLPRPVTAFSTCPQSFPVIREHIHDLFLLKGVQNPVENNTFLVKLLVAELFS